MYLAELKARAADPAPVGLVGVGRMGRGIADQMATMTGVRVRAAADLDGDRALRALTENGWQPEGVCVTDDLATAVDALRAGRAVATQDPLLVPRLPVEAVVEATGDPTTGARVAAASCRSASPTRAPVSSATSPGTARSRGTTSRSMPPAHCWRYDASRTPSFPTDSAVPPTSGVHRATGESMVMRGRLGPKS